MGLLWLGVSPFIYIGICASIISVLITIIPGIPPEFPFEAFHVVPPRNLDQFPKNYVLDKAEIFFEGKTPGLESVSIRRSDIFVGDGQGNLIKIDENGKSTTIIQFQHSCDNSEYNNCSWALGTRFDQNGKLIIADMYGGIIQLDVDKGIWKKLVDKNVIIDGLHPTAPNDLDIAKDGVIYWSDVSTHSEKFSSVIHEVYGQPSGRLMKYDPKTKVNSVLLSNIHMANGVCLSQNEDFVLVSEIAQARILRYHLKGPNAGKHDIFVDGVPGAPDNIRSNGKGGFYVSICVPWNDEFSFFMVKELGPLPYVRKFILRSRLILLQMLTWVKTLLPENVYVQTAENYVTNLPPLSRIGSAPKTAMVIELNDLGEIINVLRGELGEVYSISQLTLGNKYAYLTSPFDTKVWRLKIEDLPK